MAQTPEQLIAEREAIIAAIHALSYPHPNIARDDKACFGHRYSDMQGCGTCDRISKCMDTGGVVIIVNEKED